MDMTPPCNIVINREDPPHPRLRNIWTAPNLFKSALCCTLSIRAPCGDKNPGKRRNSSRMKNLCSISKKETRYGWSACLAILRYACSHVSSIWVNCKTLVLFFMKMMFMKPLSLHKRRKGVFGRGAWEGSNGTSMGSERNTLRLVWQRLTTNSSVMWLQHVALLTAALRRHLFGI